MASLSMGFGAATNGMVFAATATAKSGGGSREEKGILDWILGGLAKEDQLLETDPILQKKEEKNGSAGSRKSTNSVSVPNTKKKSGGFGGFGGLFAKK